MFDGDGIDDLHGPGDHDDGPGPVTAPWSPYAGGHPFAATGSGELHGTKNAADAGRPGDHDDHDDQHDGKHLAAAHEHVVGELAHAAQGAKVPITEHPSAGHLVEAVIDHVGKAPVWSATVAVPPGQAQAVEPLRDHLPPDAVVVITSPDPGTAARAADALGRADDVRSVAVLGGEVLRTVGHGLSDGARTLGVAATFALGPAVGLSTVALACGGADTAGDTRDEPKDWFRRHAGLDVVLQSGGSEQEAYDTWSHCHIACEGARRCGPAVVLYAGTAYELVHEGVRLLGLSDHLSFHSDLHAQRTGIRLRFEDDSCRSACLRQMQAGEVRFWSRYLEH